MRKLVGIVAGTVLLLLAAAGPVTAATAPPAKDPHPVQGVPTKPPPGVSPSSAANKIVQGAGDTHDDLSDEATLCNGCTYWNGNYAGFWQTILYADGFLPYSEVDCEFGPITDSATRNWQANYGLAADGRVGPNTRGVADDYLHSSGDPNFNVYYQGYYVDIYLWRDTTSPYNYWIWWNGDWRQLEYNAKTIVGC